MARGITPFIVGGIATLVVIVAGAIGYTQFSSTPTVTSASAPEAEGSPFPKNIGGEFDLVDHHGNSVTHEDFRGQHLLVFFGYANCPSICSAALPLMGQAIDELGPDAERLKPVMITIDPDWDTPEEMRRVLPGIHPRLLGLTGTREQVLDAHDAYQVTFEKLGEDHLGDPIYTHGTYIYLMGPEGELETIVPPVLAPKRLAEIIRTYL